MWTAETALSLKGNVITFLKDAEDFEAYPEEGMQARVVNVELNQVPTADEEDRPENYVWAIDVDYTEFDSVNKPLESANYYDKNGVPRLTAREADFYETVERLYLPGPELWDRYFTTLPTKRTKLVEQYQAEKQDDESYLEWLERKVLEG